MAPVVRFNGNNNSVSRSPVDEFYWVNDRSPVLMSSTNVDGNAVISFDVVDNGTTSGFARYQGAKLAKAGDPDGNLGLEVGSRFEGKFFIDSNWKLDAVGQDSGLWIVLRGPSGLHYSVVEYVDEAATTLLKANRPSDSIEVPSDFISGFRFYSSSTGWNSYVNVTETGWVDLKFEFGSSAHKWTVSKDGTGLASYTDTTASNLTATTISTVIVNNQNFGQSESYLYDNLLFVRPGGTLTDKAVSGGNLLVGTGNTVNGFVTTRDMGIELGLSVRETNRDVTNPSSPIVNPSIDPPVQGVLTNGIYRFSREDVDPFTRVAYSVATFDANTTLADKLQNYDIRLTYDRNASVAEVQTIFIMRSKADGPGYEWVYDANSNGRIDTGETLAITDDRGTPSVTQNIQNPSWYDGTPENGFMTKGSYDVRLQVFNKNTDTLVTQNHIVIDIAGGATPPVDNGGGGNPGGGGTTPTPNPNTPTPNPNAPTPFVPSTAIDPSPNDGFNEAKAAASVATFFTGAAPSAAKQAELNAFANLQFEAYQKAGVLNPAMGPYEALGRGFSETIEFSQKYAALTEAEFITARYVEVFGRDPSAAQQAHFQAQIDYFELIYENAGISSAQADIYAKGAVLGQMIGHAALDPVTATTQASTAYAWDLAA